MCESLSRVPVSSLRVLLAAPCTAARQAPLSMGFLWQESWRGLPFPPPGDLPNSGIKPASLALAGRFFTAEPRRRVQFALIIPHT